MEHIIYIYISQFGVTSELQKKNVYECIILNIYVYIFNVYIYIYICIDIFN